MKPNGTIWPSCRRLQVTAMDISVNVDNALEAMRAYFVRSTRELHNKGAFMDLNAEDPESTLPEGYQPLEMQLEALEAFHSFWSSRLRTFKVEVWRRVCRASEFGCGFFC